VSYGRNLPYHLLIDLVRSILDLPFAAAGEQGRAALERRVSAVLGDGHAELADTVRYLANLLSLPARGDEADRTAVDPDFLQGRYVAALHRLLREVSSRGPVVMVCEDLHWADPSSVEVARQLLPLSTKLPILFVGALRAEAEAEGWSLLTLARDLFGPALAEMWLQPLTDADSRALVANLLEIESLPDHVRELILTRAEGNPFFVEEVVRMLIERGVIVARDERWVATTAVSTIDIPETLHGLLLARIDQLPESAKRSLRIAAVIGRQFPVRVLERVIGGEG